MFESEEGELYSGSIRLTGIGGSITGQDVDYMIVDDPYKGLAEEFTPSALQKMIDYYNTVLEQRLEPNVSKLVILHTRWHSNDLQGYLKDNDPNSYRFISFPSINEDGTPLWAKRYTIYDLLDKKRRMGERSFNAIYQQQPMDYTSDFFDIDKIKWGLPSNFKPTAKCRAWDIASSDEVAGEKNDSTAGVWLMKSGNDVVIQDLVHGQFGSYTKNIIVNQTELDKVETAQIIETGVAAAGELLFQEWQKQLTGYRVVRAMAVKSKVDRATPLQNGILDGHLYINVNDKLKRAKLLRELSEFPFGLHDDIVDAIAHGWNYLMRMSSAQVGIVNI